MEIKESYILIAVVLLVFAGIFVFITNFKTTETTVDGVKIFHQGEIKETLRFVLEKKPLLIQMELVNASDKRNSALAVIASELTSNLRFYGKESQAYGLVDGIPSQNCNANTSNCSGAAIIIRIGECNCLRITKDTAILEGSIEFFLDQKKTTVIKGIFGLAASGQ